MALSTVVSSFMALYSFLFFLHFFSLFVLQELCMEYYQTQFCAVAIPPALLVQSRNAD